jgi:hypothetical protein
MTITAEVHFDGQTETFSAWGGAEDAVRFKFNPSALPSVNRVKALTSLLVAEIDKLKSLAGASAAPDEMSAQEILTEARKYAVSASMWAVLGATKGF